jgi:hypothetical protein
LALINKRLKIAKNYKVVLFGDEVSFDMWVSLSRTSAPLGKQPAIKTTMQNKAFNPIGINLLYTDAVMLQANFSPDLIEYLSVGLNGVEVIDKNRLLSNIKYQISNIKYQISNIKYQISNIKYQISNIKYQIFYYFEKYEKLHMIYTCS